MLLIALQFHPGLPHRGVGLLLMEACRLPSDDRDISKDAINVLVKQVTFSSRFPGMFSAEDKRPVERSNTGYFIRLPLASWGTVQTTYL